MEYEAFTIPMGLTPVLKTYVIETIWQKQVSKICNLISDQILLTRTINEKKVTLEERNVVRMLCQWRKSHEVALDFGKIL
jgi:hypothetical protein